MEPFIGTILAFGFDFPPKGWAYCDGSLLQIRQSTALFSLLGTYYGGNGQTTFGLPNLAGRTAVGFSNSIAIGQTGGSTTNTMTAAQMPAHTHGATATLALPVYSDAGDVNTAAGNSPGIFSGTNAYTNEAPDVSLASFNATANLMPAGGSMPMQTLSPYIVLNYSIALQGIFPSRN